jgi:hypothetical protein
MPRYIPTACFIVDVVGTLALIPAGASAGIMTGGNDAGPASSLTSVKNIHKVFPTRKG